MIPNKNNKNKEILKTAFLPASELFLMTGKPENTQDVLQSLNKQTVVSPYSAVRRNDLPSHVETDES